MVGKRCSGYIIFLQETYSTIEVENIWKAQWYGDLYFAHDSEHRRGVMVLIKASLHCKLKSCIEGSQVRFIIVRADVQEQPFAFVNTYAPNKTNEQCIFLPKKSEGDRESKFRKWV